MAIEEYFNSNFKTSMEETLISSWSNILGEPEDKIIKKTLQKIGDASEDIEKILRKAKEIEENSHQILEFTKEVKNMDEKGKIQINI